MHNNPEVFRVSWRYPLAVRDLEFIPTDWGIDRSFTDWAFHTLLLGRHFGMYKVIYSKTVCNSIAIAEAELQYAAHCFPSHTEDERLLHC